MKNYKGKKPKRFVRTDSIFLKNLNLLIKDATEYFRNYEYSKAKQGAENFFWKNFADNYIEIVKKRVYQEKGDKRVSAQYTLYQSLLTIIKLIAPIMPFITEELYQTYFKNFEKDKSIHISKWPKQFGTTQIKDNVWFILLNTIAKVRQEKTKAKKAMNAEIVLYLEEPIQVRLSGIMDDLKAVTNAKQIKTGKFRVDF